MVVIRLVRCGSKHRPKYRVIVADQRRSPTGRCIETLGHYDPLSSQKEGSNPVLNVSALQSWISKGAQPTKRVQSLLKKIETSQKENTD